MYDVMKSSTFFVLVSSVIVIETQCANILGVFPIGFKSHYIIFQPIMSELARRGHNVTVINAFPRTTPQTNFTDIDVRNCSTLPDVFGMDVAHIYNDPFLLAREMLLAGVELYKTVPMFECEPMKQFLLKNDSYDLVITELFHGDITLGFVHKFKAFHVAFCPVPVYPWGADRMGNPSNPSYIPYPYTDEEFDRFHPTFYQRLYNTILYLFVQSTYFYYSYGTEEVAKKAFGSDMPRLDELAKNTSLILSFSHLSYNAPSALVPGVVQIAGVQINPAKPLPKDIQNFIDESEHGVIYFCMGSLLRIETMPESKKEAFLKAFSKLPQRVIWKWGDDDLPGKTDRIFNSKWMPQRDILAHPNVKLFISHGGALGLNEAIYEGVPVLGIPMYADQIRNLRMLQSYGAAEILHYPDIDSDAVLAKITQVLEPTYSTNMKKVSQIFKDRPMSPMDTAIYWIEYVIRHKGARHLRTVAADMPLYQYLLLDVIAFISAAVISAIFLIYYALRKSWQFFTRQKPTLDSKKKI